MAFALVVPAGTIRAFEDVTALVVVPATAGAVKVAVPLVEPESASTPLVLVAVPTVKVVVPS